MNTDLAAINNLTQNQLALLAIRYGSGKKLFIVEHPTSDKPNTFSVALGIIRKVHPNYVVMKVDTLNHTVNIHRSKKNEIKNVPVIELKKMEVMEYLRGINKTNNTEFWNRLYHMSYNIQDYYSNMIDRKNEMNNYTNQVIRVCDINEQDIAQLAQPVQICNHTNWADVVDSEL